MTGIQELIILMIVIGVLSSTGVWPRILQGLRELRGEGGGGLSPQDMDMCYKILGLSPGSNWAEIEQAYRKKAKVHHPDRGGDEDAMRVLNDVYAKLKKAHRA
jgi:DnaJ-domain-containing protein 1